MWYISFTTAITREDRIAIQRINSNLIKVDSVSYQYRQWLAMGNRSLLSRYS